MSLVKVILNFYFITLTVLGSNSLQANDTIKRKTYLQIGLSTKQMFLGVKRNDFNSSNLKPNYLYNGSRYNETYYISGRFSFDMNYNYCITNLNKRHKNIFYVGINFNASKYDVLHKIEDYYNQSHFVIESYTYDKHEFSYVLNNLNVGTSLSYFINLKKIVIFQKIGINYSYFNTKSQYYKQDYYFYQNEPTLIPPKVTEIQSATTVIDEIPQSNDINPNYCIGIGYNVKNIAPYLNFEFTRFGNYFNKVYSKLSLGVIIKL